MMFICAETAAVLKERVAESTRGGYDSRIVSFMIWLFDNDHRDLLQPCILRGMEVADAADKQKRTKRGRPSKKRDSLRQLCRDIIISIDPKQSHTLPIKLEELSVDVFTSYLNTFKKKVKRTSGEDFGDTETEIRLKPSLIGGATSSLSHLFQESGIDKDVNKVTKELWACLASYKKGTRRISARQHHKLGLSATEGKKPLPFRAYCHLAKILFESENAEYIAAHSFLLLDWNLISRAEFVVGAKIDLVSAVEDALVFEIGKTKTDQEGTKNIDHPVS